MRAFVTGGSGFVGGTLIRHLVAQGYTVHALARSEAARERVQRAGAIPIMGTLEETSSLTSAMQGCDVAFHSAAALHFGRASLEQEQSNVAGTRSLLQAAKASGVPRFVAVSAASVIADGRPVIDADETRPLPRHFVGPYSRTKALAEQLILAANSPTLATVAIRPPGIWGVGDGNILPQLNTLVKNGQFVWFDHGRYAYSTCHVDNVCEGLLAAAQHGRGGNTYFVTDGPAIPFRQFVQGLLTTQNLQVGERSIPWRMALAAAGMLESVWRVLGRQDAPFLTRESVVLTGPCSVRDGKARRELGYIGAISRDAGFAALKRATAAAIGVTTTKRPELHAAVSVFSSW